MTDFSITGPSNMATISKALPDEPAFIILGRDPDGAHIVKLWADRRSEAGDAEHAQAVYPIAEAMALWAKDHKPGSAPSARSYESNDDIIVRLRKDIETIRESGDRTGSRSRRNLRWEGMENPNGWRLMGDLANDVEKLLNLIVRHQQPEEVD